MNRTGTLHKPFNFALLTHLKYTRIPNNMRRMDRGSAVRFFIQPMNYKPSHHVILSEAKLQRSPECFRGEARISISDHFWMHPLQEEQTEMFESLASCFAFRCSAFAQHDSAVYEMSLTRVPTSCPELFACLR